MKLDIPWLMVSIGSVGYATGGLITGGAIKFIVDLLAFWTIVLILKCLDYIQKI